MFQALPAMRLALVFTISQSPCENRWYDVVCLPFPVMVYDIVLPTLVIYIYIMTYSCHSCMYVNMCVCVFRKGSLT